MTPEVRHVPVALSADALMLQWARREQAPAGSAIAVDNEIAARTRGGSHWVRPDSLTVAVLARPRTLEPDVADVAWLAGGVGAAAALDDLTAERYVCHWPDRVECAVEVGAQEHPSVVVTSSTLLGPGRIEHIVVIARIAGASHVPSASLISTTIEHLRNAVGLLDEPDHIVNLYRARCATLGERLTVGLLPHGIVRGRAIDLGSDGSLVIESATGMRERIAVAAFDFLSSASR